MNSTITRNDTGPEKTISALPSASFSLGIKYISFVQNGIQKYSKAQCRMATARSEEDDSCYTMYSLRLVYVYLSIQPAVTSVRNFSAFTRLFQICMQEMTSLSKEHLLNISNCEDPPQDNWHQQPYVELPTYNGLQKGHKNQQGRCLTWSKKAAHLN